MISFDRTHGQFMLLLKDRLMNTQWTTADTITFTILVDIVIILNLEKIL